MMKKTSDHTVKIVVRDDLGATVWTSPPIKKCEKTEALAFASNLFAEGKNLKEALTDADHRRTT